ncbi:hypothetical protein G9464_01865 [Halostella sp. JP-L12]|uniref:hypothetical protein n=1 Tax=Halostella TaxID=1843185 RepID=UPI000EF7EEE1|nr:MULTISPECIES: hypothetical protein [Halostella]NHN46347.1 hypothetical protein [Halostella sp. JP-L12]
MDSDKSEACGRCSMTTVVDATDGEGGSDPFDGERIEVDPDEMRAVAKPAILLGRVKDRLDAVATRLTYGR